MGRNTPEKPFKVQIYWGRTSNPLPSLVVIMLWRINVYNKTTTFPKSAYHVVHAPHELEMHAFAPLAVPLYTSLWNVHRPYLWP